MFREESVDITELTEREVEEKIATLEQLKKEVQTCKKFDKKEKKVIYCMIDEAVESLMGNEVEY